MLLVVTSCWSSYDGLASHPGGLTIVLVTLCWVSFVGLKYHPGGSSNTPNNLLLKCDFTVPFSYLNNKKEDY